MRKHNNNKKFHETQKHKPDSLFTLSFAQVRVLVSLLHDVLKSGTSDSALKLGYLAWFLFDFNIDLRKKCCNFTKIIYFCCSFLFYFAAINRVKSLTWPFLCLRLYRTVQLIFLGLRLKSYDAWHLPFKKITV